MPLRVTTTNQIALQQLCEQGMGIARLFHIDARSALAQGELVRVLPRWRLVSHPVTMLTFKRDGAPAKVRVATAALEKHFSKH